MNKEIFETGLPPVIRVFLSSTFADMEKERSYFNDVLVPRLNRLCAERGVSFFSIDLRWGITEEEQINGQVLPICLGEIDKCRPFFIGILGNRYGSVMESVPSQIGETIPWLNGKEGKSITELEMLYAVLDKEKNDGGKNCVFLFREDALSEEWYGQGTADAKLDALKETVRSDPSIPSMSYGSLEAFGDLVMGEIVRWLDSEFPVPEKVNEVRRNWYNRELLRNYLPLPNVDSFLASYFQQSDRPLLLYGDGSRGKTAFLTHWEPSAGEKILINCGSDDLYLYWPSVAREICDRLKSINPAYGGPEYQPRASMSLRLVQMLRKKEGAEKASSGNGFYLVSDEEREQYRDSFVSWLSRVEPEQDIYLFINDLNLLEDESSHFLSWLPASVHPRLHIACTTNSGTMVKNAEILGWNTKEMPLFPAAAAGEFLRTYLNSYGKNLSDAQEQTLLRCCAVSYPGNLRFVANFLIDCGRFHNLSELIEGIAGQKDLQGIYRFVYQYLVKDFSQNEYVAATFVFGLLRNARTSLTEQDCYRLVKSGLEISALEWARVRNVFERFELISGDYWNMRNGELCKFTDGLFNETALRGIQEILADEMLTRLHGENAFSPDPAVIREKTACAKAAVLHCTAAKNWKKLQAVLTDHHVLYYLSKLDWKTVRVAWVQMFLSSQTDIPEILFGLLKRYRSAEGDHGEIIRKIANLFCDLEYRSLFDRVKEEAGVKYVTASSGESFSWVTPEFSELYAGLNELKKQRRFRDVYERISELLNGETEFSPQELCQLFFFKADSEAFLQLTEELLKTTYQYYNAAVQASAPSELIRALSFRGDALYGLEQYGECEACHCLVRDLSLQEGMLRSYLGSQNMVGRCLYRRQKYDESMQVFDDLDRCWQRVGDLAESVTVRLNKCNACSVKGDIEGALNTVEELISDIPQTTQRLRNLRLSAIGNRGAYLSRLGEFDKAEAVLLEVIAEAKESGQESSLIHATENLIDIYRQSSRFMEEAELQQSLMELFWQRQEYGPLLKSLSRTVESLRSNKYSLRAKELYEAWEGRFAGLEGGVEIFRRQMDSSFADSRDLDQLQQQLILAESEGNLPEQARLNRLLGDRLPASDWKLRSSHYQKAAELYQQEGDRENGELCQTFAVNEMFDGETLRDPEAFTSLFGRLTDPQVKQVADLWKQIGETSLPKSVSLMDRLMGKRASACNIGELAAQIGAMDASCSLVVYCLYGLAGKITEACSAEEMVALVRGLTDSTAETIGSRLAKWMVKDLQKDMDHMCGTCVGEKTDRLLAYYGKFLALGEIAEASDIAAVAGNLAIVYRRRGDVEQTLKHHNLSMEAYRKEGLMKDCMIETMNLATAYQQFKMQDQALDLLRKGIVEAREAGIFNMEAGMAGNLAAILTPLKNPENYDEIVACFGIEESYYRRVRNYRDLVISLVNQCIYFVNNDRIDGVCLEKLQEVGALIREHRFHEFDQTLSQLEMYVARKTSAPRSNLSEEMVRAAFDQLLEKSGAYRLTQLTLEDGRYHGIFQPVTESETEYELGHLLLEGDSLRNLRVIFLGQSKRRREKVPSVIGEYVAWWNSQGDYNLFFREEEQILQGNFAFGNPDWEKTMADFARFSLLWKADLTFYGAMCLGLADLDLYRKKKLELWENRH